MLPQGGDDARAEPKEKPPQTQAEKDAAKRRQRELDAVARLKATTNKMTASLVAAADGASPEAREKTLRSVREMLCKAGETQLAARLDDGDEVGGGVIILRHR